MREVITTLIQKCTKVTSLKPARQLHAILLTTAPTAIDVHSPYMNNNILSMYARSGSLFDSWKLFDKMLLRNLISYNAMVSACSRDLGYAGLCFWLLVGLGFEGIRPNGSTFTSLLQACCSIGDWVLGCLAHGKVVKFGFMNDACVQTSLLGMYSGCGDLESSRRVFDWLREKDVVSWNSMIFGNFSNGKIEEGIQLFGEMVRSGVVATLFTYSMVLNVCGRWRDYSNGRVIHALTIVLNVEADLPFQNSLLAMYFRCGDFKSGCIVFSGIKNPDLVSWNTIISGCTENGEDHVAIDFFAQLHKMSYPKPDEYTFVAVLSASRTLPSNICGKCLHAQVLKIGLERSVLVGTMLLSMYFKNEDVESAQAVSVMTEEKDVIFWTEMIIGHARLGNLESAIKLFRKVHQEGHEIDSFALSGALSACADLATLKQGEVIHAQAVKIGCDAEMSVCGSLVDMYAKNGYLHAAQAMFSQIPNPDLKCWNSMLGGYSQHGMADEAMMLFQEILKLGLIPDHVTFLSLLSACNHRGLVDKGKLLWDCMKRNNIISSAKHKSCMVSLLSRSGLLNEAEELIMESDDSKGCVELWRTLLSSCVSRRNLTIGVQAAEQVLRLEPEDSATYILLSNLYAATERWDCVAEVRRKIRKLLLEKDSGQSWIEVKSQFHVFSSCDQSNPIIDAAQSEVYRLQILSIILKDLNQSSYNCFLLRPQFMSNNACSLAISGHL